MGIVQKHYTVIRDNIINRLDLDNCEMTFILQLITINIKLKLELPFFLYVE